MLNRAYTKKGIDKINEDQMAFRKLPDGIEIAILVDGMGGLSHANIAAQIVTDTVINFIIDHIDTIGYVELLRAAIEEANKTIKDKSYELKCRMGAAIATVLITQEKIYYSWLGNVRIYEGNKDHVSQLSIDHIKNASQSSGDKAIYLTKCIKGKIFENSIPCAEATLTIGNRIWLCSDGFYQYYSKDELRIRDVDYLFKNIDHNLDDVSIIELEYS